MQVHTDPAPFGAGSFYPTAAPALSSQAYKLSGVYNAAVRLSQIVQVSGHKGDCFVLGGWAKGDSVPLGEHYGVDRQFGTSGYWLRNPGDADTKAMYVYYYGGVCNEGTLKITEYIGVRPCAWISIAE